MKRFLKVNEKYALLVIPQVWHKLPENFTSQLNTETILATSLELPDTHWKEWLGSLMWEEITEANLYLIVKSPSNNPDIQDHEEENLKNKAAYWWHLLKLTGSFKMEEPIILTGSRHSLEVEIRSKGTFPLWYHQGDGQFVCLNNSHVTQWKKLYAANELVTVDFRERQNFKRIVYGLRNFVHAMELEFITWRLPALVRSIEAFIKPTSQGIGKTFARRGAFLTRDDQYQSNLTESTFTDIYNLRCDYDHLYDMPKPTEAELKIINVCEDFSRRLYRRFLLDTTFRTHFSHDTAIDAFWKYQNM
jgi:hypothetical protein